jgi:hypothetical protein
MRIDLIFTLINLAILVANVTTFFATCLLYKELTNLED